MSFVKSLAFMYLIGGIFLLSYAGLLDTFALSYHYEPVSDLTKLMICQLIVRSFTYMSEDIVHNCIDIHYLSSCLYRRMGF